MTTEVDYSTKDIADRCGLSARMVNIYRAAAEARLKRKLGYKVGRATYFRPDDVKEILKQREFSTGDDFAGSEPTSPNFQEVNNAAEDGILTGIDGLVATGDQNAIAIGQALGMRWNGLLMSAALQQMQVGMVEMSTQFKELHASVSVGLNSATLPQLTGTHPATPALSEHFETDDQL